MIVLSNLNDSSLNIFWLCHPPLRRSCCSSTTMSRKASSYDFFISDEELEARMAELLHLEHAALEPSSRAALDSHVRSYQAFCRSARLPPFPASFKSVGLFLIQYCRWNGHTARSIPSTLSHLKRANRHYSSSWLTEEENWRLKDLITTLHKKDANPSRQKLPITHQVMNAMQSVADLTSHQDFQLMTMCRVARDALLRGVELTKLLIGEVSWNANRTEATLHLHYTKAHKELDAPERVIITDYGPASGVAFLREYFNVMGLDRQAPASPLWPLIDDMGNTSWHVPTSKYRFIARSRHLLDKAGFPPKLYAGHSFRSGGATDLWDSQLCRPLTIKLHGRWKSEAYRLYIRDNPHRTAQEVARAMAFFEAASATDCPSALPLPRL